MNFTISWEDNYLGHTSNTYPESKLLQDAVEHIWSDAWLQSEYGWLEGGLSYEQWLSELEISITPELK
jgi:hypothetical protein